MEMEAGSKSKKLTKKPSVGQRLKKEKSTKTAGLDSSSIDSAGIAKTDATNHEIADASAVRSSISSQPTNSSAHEEAQVNSVNLNADGLSNSMAPSSPPNSAPSSPEKNRKNRKKEKKRTKRSPETDRAAERENGSPENQSPRRLQMQAFEPCVVSVNCISTVPSPSLASKSMTDGGGRISPKKVARKEEEVPASHDQAGKTPTKEEQKAPRKITKSPISILPRPKSFDEPVVQKPDPPVATVKPESNNIPAKADKKERRSSPGSNVPSSSAEAASNIIKRFSAKPSKSASKDVAPAAKSAPNSSGKSSKPTPLFSKTPLKSEPLKKLKLLTSKDIELADFCEIRAGCNQDVEIKDSFLVSIKSYEHERKSDRYFYHIFIRTTKQYQFQTGQKLELDLLARGDTTEDALRAYVYRQMVALLEPLPASTSGRIEARGICVETEAVLEMEGILPMRKKNPRFPDATHFCDLCDYHVNGVCHATSHIMNLDHRKSQEERKLRSILGQIPEPTSAQTAAVAAVIENVAKTFGRPHRFGGITEEFQHCQQIVLDLTLLFKSMVHKDCFARMYGSVYSGFALKTSNLNVELVYPENEMMHGGAALCRAERAITENGYRDVVSDYSDRVPHVFFRPKTDAPLDIEIVLSIRNSQAADVAYLLRLYGQMAPWVVPLAQTFRHWAKECHVDDCDSGGLPAYAFDVMLLHFLQQQKLLPVLHELPPDPSELPAEEKKADAPVPEHHRPGHKHDWKEHHHHHHKKPEEEDERERDFTIYPRNLDYIKQHFTFTENVNVGELWIRLLRFYAIERDNQSLVVCIRQFAELSRECKKWNRKRIAIEDPFIPRKNLAQITPKMFDYFFNCLQRTYQLFAIPQFEAGPLFTFSASKLRLLKPDERAVRCLNVESLLQREKGPATTPKGNKNGAAKKPVDNKLVTALNNVIESQLSDQVRSRDETRQSEASPIEQLTSRDESGQLEASPVAIIKRGVSTIAAEMDAFRLATIRRFAGDFVDGSMKDSLAALSNGAFYADSLPESALGNGQLESAEVEEVATIAEEAATISEEVELVQEADEQDVCEDVFLKLVKETANLNLHEGDSLKDELLKAAGRVVNGPAGEAVSLGDDLGATISPTAGDLKTAAEKTAQDADERAKMIAKMTEFGMEDFKFDFLPQQLTGDKKAPIVCSFCQCDGHRAQVCQEAVLPPLRPLGLIDLGFEAMMNRFLSDLPQFHRICPERTGWQMRFSAELETSLRQVFPDARLNLFGSSLNGFGFEDSDLDFCLRFAADELPLDIKPSRVIRKVAEILRLMRDKQSRMPRFRDIVPVTRAKVPIVRAFYPECHLEIDISYYNSLALRNTALIRDYANVDRRAWQLGYIVKVFAKACNIGDASRGSLSSYAYLLLMIYYLQQCDVLPVLQEIICPGVNPGDPQYIVDEWNTYFCPLSQLLNNMYLWPRAYSNPSSLYRLWLGFLRFYTETFDFTRQVVCIRQREPLLKLDKSWTDRPMAIEDPFDLSHNLANGVRKKMYLYIMKAFIRARATFGVQMTSQQIIQEIDQAYGRGDYEAYEYYFFVERCKTRDPLPRENTCHICGLIGHFVEQCPRRKLRRGLSETATNFEDDSSSTSSADEAEEVDINGDSVLNDVLQDHDDARLPLVFENSNLSRLHGDESPAAATPLRQASEKAKNNRKKFEASAAARSPSNRTKSLNSDYDAEFPSLGGGHAEMAASPMQTAWSAGVSHASSPWARPTGGMRPPLAQQQPFSPVSVPQPAAPQPQQPPVIQHHFNSGLDFFQALQQEAQQMQALQHQQQQQQQQHYPQMLPHGQFAAAPPAAHNPMMWSPQQPVFQQQPTMGFAGLSYPMVGSPGMLQSAFPQGAAPQSYPLQGFAPGMPMAIPQRNSVFAAPHSSPAPSVSSSNGGFDFTGVTNPQVHENLRRLFSTPVGSPGNVGTPPQASGGLPGGFEAPTNFASHAHADGAVFEGPGSTGSVSKFGLQMDASSNSSMAYFP